ncbi:MAG TPA: hypothetical protein VN238_04925 [Solirubrobacteraceae bacterium]|nr:hypothetical protein [Solirubrobacteraceae bacterium]
MTHRTIAVALTAITALGAASLAPAQAAAPTFKIHAEVKMLPGGGTILRQRGTFTGAPLGRGTVDVSTRLGARKGTRVTFTLKSSQGSVRGAGYAQVKFKGTVITYTGTADITGGSGDFADVRRKGLRFRGTGDLAGDRFAVDIGG